jgi:hypothetical protein
MRNDRTIIGKGGKFSAGFKVFRFSGESTLQTIVLY